MWEQAQNRTRSCKANFIFRNSLSKGCGRVSECELERHRSIHAALGAGIAVLETLKLVKSPIEIVFSITHL